MRTIDADALVNRIVFHTDMPSEYKEQVEDTISDMPTIEPEPHWVPVSERLPEKDGYYLVSKDDKRFFNALKPNKEIDRSWGIGMKVPVCPNCEAIISPMYFFKNCEDKVGWCEYCGQKIDWSGWE